MFTKIGITGITVTNKEMARGDMLVRVESVSMSPSVGKIGDMVNSLTPGADAEFTILVKKGKPIVRLRNMRVTFINRVVMELIHFQKEIEEEVMALAHLVEESMVNDAAPM